MVAHSQGNLFVHEAYKNALKLTTSNFVKVVHIASASPFTHGPHVVADKDLVIKGLNLLLLILQFIRLSQGYLSVGI